MALEYFIKKIVFIFSSFILLFSILFNAHWKFRDFYNQLYYDLSHDNSAITSDTKIEKILNSFETIKFESLDADYKKSTQSDQLPYSKILSNSQFYKVVGNNKYQKICNDFRIKDFMVKDKYYRKSTFNNNNSIYWLVDIKLLFATLELQQSLEKKKYNKNAFKIVNGHRHPSFNIKVGGASQSKHILGQAIDLSVRDINKDGAITKLDKSIVLEILEKEVIKDKGGIGKYPHSETAIHYDVRGYRARWDKQ